MSNITSKALFSLSEIPAALDALSEPKEPPKSPTKDEWDRMAAELKSIFGRVELRVDGYRLSLTREQISPTQLAIRFWVDGWFKGAWILEDCEERRRFFRPVKRHLFPSGMRRKWKGRKRAFKRACGHDLDETFTQYLPYWPSFGSLKVHLRRHNRDIELVEIRGERHVDGKETTA